MICFSRWKGYNSERPFQIGSVSILESDESIGVAASPAIAMTFALLVLTRLLISRSAYGASPGFSGGRGEIIATLIIGITLILSLFGEKGFRHFASTT